MKARSSLQKIIILAVIALFALIFTSVLSYADDIKKFDGITTTQFMPDASENSQATLQFYLPPE